MKRIIEDKEKVIKLDRYWENQSGIYDPTATEVIDNESKRNKQIHDTIGEIKNILQDRDLILVERIKLKDKTTNKVYR